MRWIDMRADSACRMFATQAAHKRGKIGMMIRKYLSDRSPKNNSASFRLRAWNDVAPQHGSGRNCPMYRIQLEHAPPGEMSGSCHVAARSPPGATAQSDPRLCLPDDSSSVAVRWVVAQDR
jgi:hypothetical protein